MKRLLFLAMLSAALSGCGRVAFDPFDPSGDGGNGGGDDGGSIVDGDGATGAGPVIHLPFEGTSTFTQTPNYGTSCVTCPTPVAGRVGAQAAQFTGTACLRVNGVAALRPAKFTLATWVNVATNGFMTVFGRPYQGMTAATNTFEIFVTSGTGWRVAVNSMQSNTGFPMNEWHHITGVFDGTILSVYLDGGFESSITPGAAVYDNDDDITVGCDINAGIEQDPFDGLVDDVRLYDRALTPAEIAALAAM